MGVETLATIAIGTAVAGAATSAQAAIQQNRAQHRAGEAAKRAAEVQRRQVREQANQERRTREREADRVRALLRVRGAAAGTGAGSSFEDLILGETLDLTQDLATIDTNTRSLFDRISSGLSANLIDLASRRRSTVIDSFSGGIQGASTGLQIGQGIKAL